MPRRGWMRAQKAIGSKESCAYTRRDAGRASLSVSWTAARGIIRPLFGTLNKDVLALSHRLCWRLPPQEREVGPSRADIALTTAVGDGEQGAEVYQCRRRPRPGQPGVFMWQRDGERGGSRCLPSDLKIIDLATSDYRPETGSVYPRHPCDAAGSHGSTPRASSSDELRRAAKPRLWDVLTSSTGAGSSPLCSPSPLRRFDRESICWELTGGRPASS